MHIRLTFIILVLVFQVLNLSSQEVKEIFIECDPDEFEYIYENYSEDINIPVTITYNNTSWEDALMRLRGDSSREYPKKSLKVQFPSDPFFTGRSVVNFNAEYHDISYMHSILSTLLFKEAGIPSPDMEHVRIYLNGDFFGLYIMTENVDEEFLTDKGMDPEETLYKATIDGACLSTYDNVFYHWDLKTGEDPYFDKLSGLIASLNNSSLDFSDYLQTHWNHDKTISFLALNMLLSNGSTYYHNYFIYHSNQEEKWQILPWDLDRTFTDYSIWYPFHRSSGTWTADNPLLERALIDDDGFQEIKEEVDVLQESIFNSEFIFPLIDSIQNAISASVEEDITDNIPDLQTWLNKISVDKDFVEDRYGQLLHQLSHSPSAFRVNRKSGYYPPGQELEFAWQPSVDPDGDAVTYSFYLSKDRDFNDPETIEMPGLTSSTIAVDAPAEPAKYYWMVEATDGNNTIQGFDTYHELFICEEVADIVINEINYNSEGSFNPGDWVELHNRQTEDVDLSGWRFRDEIDSHVFVIPNGTTIEAGGYMVLSRNVVQFETMFPAVSPVIGDLDFGFSSNGDVLRLYNQIGFLVDSVPYRIEYPWPVEPNGDGPTLELLNPALDNAIGYSWSASAENGTPGQQNGTFSPESVHDQAILDEKVWVYPNPCSDQLHIQSNVPFNGSVQVKVMDVNGIQRLYAMFEHEQGDLKIGTLEMQDLPSGVYSCVVSFARGGTYTVLLIKK